MGCGRRVAEGLDKKGLPRDTCCRACAEGEHHDEPCSSMGAITDDTEAFALDIVKGCGERAFFTEVKSTLPEVQFARFLQQCRMLREGRLTRVEAVDRIGTILGDRGPQLKIEFERLVAEADATAAPPSKAPHIPAAVSDSIVISGWLKKRGPLAKCNWNERWFVLTCARLLEYRDDSCREKLSSDWLAKRLQSCRFSRLGAPGEAVKHRSSRPFGFVVDFEPSSGKDRRFIYLDAKDQNKLAMWLKALKSVADARHRAVVLHIYDVGHETTAINSVFNKLGGGAYHAGVEIDGMEWSYGFTETGSGVDCNPPRQNDQHVYRKSIEMGYTLLDGQEVGDLVERLSNEWVGADYHLLKHNCCSFSDVFCQELGVGAIPAWVTRFMNAGSSIENAGQYVKTGIDGLEQKLHVQRHVHRHLTDTSVAVGTLFDCVDEKLALRNRAHTAVDKATVVLGNVDEKLALKEKINVVAEGTSGAAASAWGAVNTLAHNVCKTSGIQSSPKDSTVKP